MFRWPLDGSTLFNLHTASATQTGEIWVQKTTDFQVEFFILDGRNGRELERLGIPTFFSASVFSNGSSAWLTDGVALVRLDFSDRTTESLIEDLWAFTSGFVREVAFSDDGRMYVLSFTLAEFRNDLLSVFRGDEFLTQWHLGISGLDIQVGADDLLYVSGRDDSQIVVKAFQQ